MAKTRRSAEGAFWRSRKPCNRLREPPDSGMPMSGLLIVDENLVGGDGGAVAIPVGVV